MNNFYFFFKYLFTRPVISISLLYLLYFIYEVILNKTMYEHYNKWSFVENRNRTNIFLSDQISKNVSVSIFLPPFYKELYPLINNLNDIYDLYKATSNKFDVVFYDTIDSYICDNKDLFYNSSYLIKERAIVFSNKLHN